MYRWITLCFALLFFAGCSSQPPALLDYRRSSQTPGSVANVERVGFYPAFVLRGLFWYAGVKSIDVSQAVQFYRVSYWSRSDGHPTLVSGLISVPDEGPIRGTVLYMHGTKTNRADSVSNPDLQEGVFIGGAFAGGGYVELAPDLAGLGVSHDAQPYFFNPGTTEQTLDFLHAAKIVLRDLGRAWNSNLYITDFSQGGHAAALIQRELELHPDPALQVRAGAGIAGVYDISGAEFPFALSGGKSKYSGYLEDFALSYATHYHESLDSLLRPEYAQSARLLLDGDHNDAFFKQLPPDPRSLFTPEFLAAYDNKQPHWFTTDMQKNDVYAWAPRAPFRAYYGDKDIDATPNNTKFFESEATRKGGDVRAVYVGPVDHTGTAYRAVPLIRMWFDELSMRN